MTIYPSIVINISSPFLKLDEEVITFLGKQLSTMYWQPALAEVTFELMNKALWFFLFLNKKNVINQIPGTYLNV